MKLLQKSFLFFILFSVTISGQSPATSPQGILLKADEAGQKLQTVAYSLTQKTLVKIPFSEFQINVKQERADVPWFFIGGKSEVNGTSKKKRGRVSQSLAFSFDGKDGTILYAPKEYRATAFSEIVSIIENQLKK